MVYLLTHPCGRVVHEISLHTPVEGQCLGSPYTPLWRGNAWVVPHTLPWRAVHRKFLTHPFGEAVCRLLLTHPCRGTVHELFSTSGFPCCWKPIPDKMQLKRGGCYFGSSFGIHLKTWQVSKPSTHLPEAASKAAFTNLQPSD